MNRRGFLQLLGAGAAREVDDASWAVSLYSAGQVQHLLRHETRRPEMSKAQTDIRTTSYDARSARPFGYQGTIDDVIAQIRSEPDIKPTIKARAELERFLNIKRAELERFLNVKRAPWISYDGNGPSTADDLNPRYGTDAPSDELGRYTLAYAMKHFPQSFKVGSFEESFAQEVMARLADLTESQTLVYRAYRTEFGVLESLAKAESFPYPAARS